MKGLLLTQAVENLPVLHLPSYYSSSQSLFQVPREGALIGSDCPVCPTQIQSAVARGARLHKHGCRVLLLSVKRSSVSWTDTHEVSTGLLDELRLEVNICLGEFVFVVLGLFFPSGRSLCALIVFLSVQSLSKVSVHVSRPQRDRQLVASIGGQLS